MPEGHTERSQAEREGGSTDLGLCLCQGRKDGVARVSWVHSLLLNLKHKSGNQDTGREKWDGFKLSMIYLPQDFIEGEVHGQDQPRSLPRRICQQLHHRAGNSLFKMDVFEMNASAIKSLMSDICTTQRKTEDLQIKGD